MAMGGAIGCRRPIIWMEELVWEYYSEVWNFTLLCLMLIV